MNRRIAYSGVVLIASLTWTLRADAGPTDGGSADNASAQRTTAVAQSAALAAASMQDAASESSVGDRDAQLPPPQEQLRWHVPDPDADRPASLERLEQARQQNDRTEALRLTRVLERTDQIRRPEQLRLGLDQALRRALESNYAIEVQSYNPAVQNTRVVEAEAAFDALLFTNISKNNIDRPTGSDLISTDVDLFTSSYGLRKLMSTGMQVSGYYQLGRTKSAISFQTINPEYTSNLILEMRQPLLRGFGIDYNRSIIVITQHDRRISDYAFRRQVRDTLRTVEVLYWQLVQARRDVVITANLLAGFEAIYEYLVARQDFDITPVQLSATKANLEESRVDFVIRSASVFDAEDRLIAVMNSDDITLADDIEIIPSDLPHIDRILTDRVAEVQTALDFRSEIKEQELRVANAKVSVGRAKNEELPRFDLMFRTTFDGLAGNADRSFDELSRGKFIEYFIGVEFEMPIGNRGPKAAHRRSQLLYDQQVAQLKTLLEEVILDTNISSRAVSTAFDAIAPAFESAKAREREVESIVARAERKDLNTLNSELGARQSLANSRRTLVAAMVGYNIALADLERAKGTLLEYHNVAIPTEGD